MILKKTLQQVLHRFGFDLKLYKTSNFAAIKRLVKYHEIDLVIDVGANVGQYYDFLRTSGYDGRVISFEPLTKAHSILSKRVSQEPSWNIMPRMAVGSEQKESTINIAQNAVSSSLLPMLETHSNICPESIYTDSEIVKVERLDKIIPSYVDINNTNVFLKIDAQGYEKNVMEGAEGILHRVKAIQLELSLVPLYEGAPTFKYMLDLMESLGYSIYWLKPGFTNLETGQMLQLDGIFTKSKF